MADVEELEFDLDMECHQKDSFLFSLVSKYELPAVVPIPRAAIVKILTPYDAISMKPISYPKKNDKVRFHTRLDYQLYFLLFYLQIYDGRTPWISLHVLSSWLGCTYQSLKRVMKRLKKCNLISCKYHKDNANYTQISITDYEDMLKKDSKKSYGLGYIQLPVDEYLELFPFYFDNPLNSVSKKPKINKIRATLMAYAWSNDLNNNKIFYSRYKIYFPKWINRKGMLSRLFDTIDTNSVAIENIRDKKQKLCSGIRVITKGAGKQQIDDLSEIGCNVLKNRYFKFLNQNSHIHSVDPNSKEVEEQSLYRLIYKLSDQTNVSDMFNTVPFKRLGSLLSKIGINNFYKIIDNISKYINISSLSRPDTYLEDKAGKPIENLTSYLKAIRFSL